VAVITQTFVRRATSAITTKFTLKTTKY